MGNLDGPFSTGGGRSGLTDMGQAQYITVLLPNRGRRPIPWRHGLTPKAALGAVPELESRDQLYAVALEGPRAPGGSQNLTRKAMENFQLEPGDILNVNSRLYAG